ncbi:MAG: efflux RND transporter periplasmic adaptor subunit [Calditrichaeota bacterium]|nr:MAG: efflux RND transporter periplasmic adaptor subunit [Calditrichota bacterium]
MSLKQFIIFLSLFILVGCGSTDHTDADAHAETQAAVDDHAGHNHAEGEGHGTSETTTIATATDEFDWCREHSVPESTCTKCNPSLIPSFKESGDWCAGHDLPESQCRLCNPGIRFPQEEILRTMNAELADKEIAVSLFFRENQEICATNDALIQFASVRTVEKAGISTLEVHSDQQKTTVTAPAETVFDEAYMTHLTTTLKSSVTKWLKSPGEIVKEGEVLALMQSPEIAQLKSSLVSKFASYEVERKELERHQKMLEGNLISQSDFDSQNAMTEKAKAEMISIEGLLLSAGLTFTDINDVKETKAISYTFALRASSTGLLVERRAKLGELLEAGASFAVIADPQAMWIEARLTEDQMRLVTYGQKLQFTSDGSSLHAVGGEIIWKSQMLDQHTRTGTVRAKVIDPYHTLQAREFGRVIIPIEQNDMITMVPKDAVQWEGCCNVVFVKESADRYRPRKVVIEDGQGPYYQVLDGLLQGEEVVVEGSFLLKTELKKSSIGAGCCGIEPAG